jgi:4-amino-4-deoxy-L-arabinose transferase-like glycosyltransferase
MTLMDSLKRMWRETLFPMEASGGVRGRAWHWVVLTIVASLLLFSNMGFHLLEPDEGRYAQIPREMLETGDWVVPTLQSEPYLDKPPLMYWLVSLSYRTFGVSAGVARLVPGLCVLLTILSVYGIGKRSLGCRAAFGAALMLTASPGFLEMGRLLILDGLLTFCVTVSVLCGYEAVRTGRFQWSWWLMAAVFSGLGFLTKGPIAEVLLFPPMLAVGWLSGRLAKVGWKGYLAFALTVLGVSLPWYIAMAMRRPEFVSHFFIEHNLKRFAQPFDHLQPIWYYAPVLVGGLLPGIPVAILMVRDLGFRSAGRNRGLSSAGAFWLFAGCWCVAFFSASGSKLPTYVLPAFPALCLALGEFVERTSRWTWAWAGMGPCMIGLFVVNVWLLPAYAKDRSPVGRPELVLPYVVDPSVAVATYPRTVDSLAFAVGRRDFDRTRSRDQNQLILDSHFRPRTVVLFTHRHSLDGFLKNLPPSLTVTQSTSLKRTTSKSFWDRLVGDSPWGLCDIVVVQPTESVAVSIPE